MAQALASIRVALSKRGLLCPTARNVPIPRSFGRRTIRRRRPSFSRTTALISRRHRRGFGPSSSTAWRGHIGIRSVPTSQYSRAALNWKPDRSSASRPYAPTSSRTSSRLMLAECLFGQPRARRERAARTLGISNPRRPGAGSSRKKHRGACFCGSSAAESAVNCSRRMKIGCSRSSDSRRRSGGSRLGHQSELAAQVDRSQPSSSYPCLAYPGLGYVNSRIGQPPTKSAA